MLGGFIQGVTVRDGRFAGQPFDWLTPYSLLIALGLVAGYALLGACWLVWKTKDELHGDARRWAWLAGGATAVLLGAVSVATLVIHPRVAARWGFPDGHFNMDVLPFLPIPILGAAGLLIVAEGLRRREHGMPYAGAALVFLSGYLGLAVGFFPAIVPYDIDFRMAANADNALGLMLVGVAIMLPLILVYTGWVYWLFRGKVGGDEGYH